MSHFTQSRHPPTYLPILHGIVEKIDTEFFTEKRRSGVLDLKHWFYRMCRWARVGNLTDLWVIKTTNHVPSLRKCSHQSSTQQYRYGRWTDSVYGTLSLSQNGTSGKPEITVRKDAAKLSDVSNSLSFISFIYSLIFSLVTAFSTLHSPNGQFEF